MRIQPSLKLLNLSYCLVVNLARGGDEFHRVHERKNQQGDKGEQ